MSDVDAVMRAYRRIHFACRHREVAPPDGGPALSAAQADILAHLDPVDPAMVGELAEHLGVTASTMSLHLKRLDERGYVRRDPDPADRRVTNVRLTDTGVAARDAREPLDGERVHALLGLLDAGERRQAVRGLTLVARAADALVRRGRARMETVLEGSDPVAGAP